VITALVAGEHTEGHRLIRRMGYQFHGTAPGFGGEEIPMLRYLHIWPRFAPEPLMVRHQRHEFWLACLEAWCPAMHADVLKGVV
jgi:hypothetical protein